ncbi:MAG: phosphoribosyltransferase family protein [Sporolactobacillus sp.]
MNSNECLYCRKDRHLPLRFSRLLAAEDSPGFCASCLSRLSPINPQTSCAGCGRDLRLLPAEHHADGYCRDCRAWSAQDVDKYGRNTALFSYNDWMKEIFSAFKFRGDICLMEGFKKEWRDAYHRLTGRSWRDFWRRGANQDNPLLVPIPISRQRLTERGFNQADVLAQLLDGLIVPALSHDQGGGKQSKKNKRERMTMENNPFHLLPQWSEQLAGRRLLIIDDIYTTGATIRKAATSLASAQPAAIDSLTLIHG